MRSFLLFIPLAALAADAPLILQIRVIDGDGASYAAGSRAIKGITVEVTDEAGLPVPNAAVSFRLPEAGATGLFQNGSRTEIATTALSGRAVVWGMKWNRIPGTVAVRITAAKGETRAGAIVQQHLLEPGSLIGAGGRATDMPSHIRTNGPRRRWIWLSAIAAAAAGGGLAFGARQNPAGTSAAAVVSISIGNPSIVVGR